MCRFGKLVLQKFPTSSFGGDCMLHAIVAGFYIYPLNAGKENVRIMSNFLGGESGWLICCSYCRIGMHSVEVGGGGG